MEEHSVLPATQSLGRVLARELTPEEVDEIGGALGSCWSTNGLGTKGSNTYTDSTTDCGLDANFMVPGTTDLQLILTPQQYNALEDINNL